MGQGVQGWGKGRSQGAGGGGRVTRKGRPVWAQGVGGEPPVNRKGVGNKPQNSPQNGKEQVGSPPGNKSFKTTREGGINGGSARGTTKRAVGGQARVSACV